MKIAAPEASGAAQSVEKVFFDRLAEVKKAACIVPTVGRELAPTTTYTIPSGKIEGVA